MTAVDLPAFLIIVERGLANWQRPDAPVTV
jgi:hypothetical protein